MEHGDNVIVKLWLLGVLTVTSYRPIPAQTKPDCKGRFQCTTSIDDGITRFGVAVSQDLLKSGEAHYGDIVWVDGYGYRVINDCMGPKARRAIDLMVFTHREEKQVGVRKLKVYLIKGGPNELPGLSEGR